MARLTKQQRKFHQTACSLLEKDRLSDQDCEFILTHWHEGAECNNGRAGAFFTPVGLAADFSIEVGPGRILDLCAGIGALSYYVYQRNYYRYAPPEIVCIEKNPAYVAVGRKVLPQATWICADIFDLPDLNLGYFDTVISNPPFSNIERMADAPRYRGQHFEFHAIDLASDYADRGVFILPQGSCPFQYSGRAYFDRRASDKVIQFENLTGCRMDIGVGIDTKYYLNDWKDVSPICEIATIDFEEVRAGRPLYSFASPKHAKSGQMALF